MRNRSELEELQRLPLKYKEMLTADRIRELTRNYGTDDFYVSFSGGKDSEVLVDIMAANLSKLGYYDMNVLYVNTGLEYSSVRESIKPFLDLVSERHQIGISLDVRTPETTFKDVLRKYGYPLISKEVAQVVEEARKGIKNADGTYYRSRAEIEGRLLDASGEKSRFNCDRYNFLLNAPFKASKHCCPITKQNPCIKYEKEKGRIPVIGTLAEESQLRQSKWLRFGCNAFSCERPQSMPLSIWRENNILSYIKKYDLPLALPYGKIRERSRPDEGYLRGQTLLFDFPGENTEKEYELTGAKRTGCCYCLFGIQFDPERILRMQKLEPKKADFVLRGGEFDEEGMWGPSDDGLGFWYVCDYLTEHGIPVPYTDNNYRHQWADKIAA